MGQQQKEKSINQVHEKLTYGAEASHRDLFEGNENLARPMENIRGDIRGRGIGKFDHIGPDCICDRPYTHIMCYNCGHLMFGRVRYGCPKHKMVTFLIDISNCPKCKAFEYMLDELTNEELKNGHVQDTNNNFNSNGVMRPNNYDEEEDEDL